jgi:hypothetical protein
VEASRKPPNIIVRLLRSRKREEFGHSTINLNITYLIICFEMGFEMAGIIKLFDKSMILIVLWLKVPGLMEEYLTVGGFASVPSHRPLHHAPEPSNLWCQPLEHRIPNTLQMPNNVSMWPVCNLRRFRPW